MNFSLQYFLKTGACKYGSTCKYHHPKDRNGAGPVLFNVLGYPMRQGEKSCPFYIQNGMCRFGVACKFHHPHPHHQPQPQPLNGHSTYGMSSFPSVGFPYAGGMPMMSLPPATYGVMPSPGTYGAMPPPATYGAMPRPQPHTYMPFMAAPSQGLLPPQSWGSYMAASNSYNNIGLTLPSLPTPYASRVSTRPKISSPPSRSDSTTLANSNKPAAEKQEGSPAEPDNSEVQDSSPPSHSDSTILSNGKSGAEIPSSETKKQDDNPA